MNKEKEIIKIIDFIYVIKGYNISFLENRL